MKNNKGIIFLCYFVDFYKKDLQRKEKCSSIVRQSKKEGDRTLKTKQNQKNVNKEEEEKKLLKKEKRKKS